MLMTVQEFIRRHRGLVIGATIISSSIRQRRPLCFLIDRDQGKNGKGIDDGLGVRGDRE